MIGTGQTSVSTNTTETNNRKGLGYQKKPQVKQAKEELLGRVQRAEAGEAGPLHKHSTGTQESSRVGLPNLLLLLLLISIMIVLSEVVEVEQ